MSSQLILIMAGGTGGHVFPALAVAKQLRAWGVEVEWLGTRRGLEASVVPQEGIRIHFISIGGLRGKGAVTLLWAPFKLIIAIAQSLSVMIRLRPVAVLGMGGFVTGPGGVAAWVLRRPLLIHEQNAVAGMTNRWLARLAVQVLEAFPQTFADKLHKVTSVGNPVREEITRLLPPEQRYGRREGPLRILVLGGSLGATALNQAVPAAIALMPPGRRPQVLHQAGNRHRDATLQAYCNAGVPVEQVEQVESDDPDHPDHPVQPVQPAKVVRFIDHMEQAYAWADLVVCRAGALTITELKTVGIASILIPYPHAVDDHQTVNARSLVDLGAAILMPQDYCSPDCLQEQLTRFTSDDMSQARIKLLKMARAAFQSARPNATAEVAERCLREAGLRPPQDSMAGVQP